MLGKSSTLFLMCLSVIILAFPFYSNAEVLKPVYTNSAECPQIEYLRVMSSGVLGYNSVSMSLINDRTKEFFMHLSGKWDCGERRDTCVINWESSDKRWDVSVYDRGYELGDDVAEYTFYLVSKRNKNLECKWNKFGY